MKRFGIAEWYGHSLVSLTLRQRREFAEIALAEDEEVSPPACPFNGKMCSKAGGVCSIRPFEAAGDRLGATAGEAVIVCPTRFEQEQAIIRWLADIVEMPAGDARVAREVPFMTSQVTKKPAGKIDLVLSSAGAEQWFGLEIQAVYFSGPAMRHEFLALRADESETPPFPQEHRRPDFRSSGAKRLMPQLQVKGPTLRRWHSKIAVAVDGPFFASLGGPSEQPSHDLDEGDVIWLVPELTDDYRLERGHWEVLTLEQSTAKLLSADPVSRRSFEDELRRRLTRLASAPQR